MNDYNELLDDIRETIEEHREVTIYNSNVYRHFYEENSKIISCDKMGVKEFEFNNLDELLKDIGLTEQNIDDYVVEMY